MFLFVCLVNVARFQPGMLPENENSFTTSYAKRDGPYFSQVGHEAGGEGAGPESSPASLRTYPCLTGALDWCTDEAARAHADRRRESANPASGLHPSACAGIMGSVPQRPKKFIAFALPGAYNPGLFIIDRL